MQATDWRTVDTLWERFFPVGNKGASLPATFETPDAHWDYGASTELLTVEAPSTLRLKLRVDCGVIAFSMVSDDYSELRSDTKTVSADDGPTTVELRLLPRKTPAYLTIRSTDSGERAEVTIESLEIAPDRDGAAPVDHDVLAAATRAALSGSGRYDAVAAVKAQASNLAVIAPSIAKALVEMEVGEVFALSQGLVLAAAVRDFQPDVIIDLGTGRGGSAVSLATANPDLPVYTFDNEPQWSGRIDFLLSSPPLNVHPIVTDIVEYDFAPLLAPAGRVMVFLDAHGFEVAAKVFSHILPLIADKPHLVFCHDIEDLRYKAEDDRSGSYNGKRMWRGSDDYFRNFDTTDYARVGWMWTGMDQAIALTDFAGRNRLTVESVDHQIGTASPSDRAQAQSVLGEAPIHLTFFTMNETHLRHFPAG